ncbi:hypothetical protein, partial [Comamonas terrigena]|uniref:hypothetical protein n=1 Tax=Comamonas terrigena TaxID=32013 RepID=UPI0024483031
IGGASGAACAAAGVGACAVVVLKTASPVVRDVEKGGGLVVLWGLALRREGLPPRHSTARAYL